MEKLMGRSFGISYLLLAFSGSLFATASASAEESALRYSNHGAICDKINKDFGSASTMRWQSDKIMDFMSRDAAFVTPSSRPPKRPEDSTDTAEANEFPGHVKCNKKFEGKATVYSNKFIGRPTHNEEPMSQQARRAASLNSAGSNQLPTGTWVRVSRGGKSTIICINDTGAGGAGRVIDLTTSVADSIGHDRGTGRVTIECLVQPARTTNSKGKKIYPKCDDSIGRKIAEKN